MSTVLITGASSGIGEATARKLLSEGHVVWGAARRVDEMQGLRDLGGHVIRMDVTREEDMVVGVRTIEEAHGGVDVLVNNAGFGMYGAVEDTDLDDARYQFEVNLFGLARLTQLVLPGMRERRAGRIINVSSMGGRMYTPLGSWYHATKHALEGWSDCLRLEVAQFGIHVVIIQPGIIVTEFDKVMSEPMMARSAQGPYGDLARRAEDASAAAYREGRGSPPTVIADVISRAVSARRPRTRYVRGTMARPLLFLRRWLSDRMFDRLVMSQY